MDMALRFEGRKIETTTHDPPINTLPTELLQLIFGLAIPNISKRSTAAKILSQVCHRWREIALNSVNLWTTIDISIDKSEKEIHSQWSRFVQLSEGRPPTITIRGIRTNAKTRLSECSLDSFPIIKRLSLHIEGGNLFWSLVKFMSTPRRERIDELELIFALHAKPGPWYIATIFQKCPLLQRLSVSGLLNMFWPQQCLFPTLHSLHLRGNSDVKLNYIASCAPELRELELANCSSPDDGSALLFPKLRILRITENLYHLSLLLKARDRLSCPNLEELELDYTVNRNDTISFLQRHPTIHSTTLKGMDLNGIFRVASQLRHLTLTEVDLPIPGITSTPTNGPFPSLLTLTIHDLHQWLKQDQFDGVVRARCLPSNHPQSRLLPGVLPLQGLSVIIQEDRRSVAHHWQNSDLHKEAERVVYHDEANSWIHITHSWTCA